MNQVAVLMATYNGEQYIREQIDSILNQSFPDFDLIIRDDCSTDKTIEIIKKYLSFDNVILLDAGNRNVGHLENFARLFDYAKNRYEYILFTDQDDIWRKNKLSLSFHAISQYGDIPAMAYSNFTIWNMGDNRKNTFLQKSFAETFERILVQNWIFGCTMILNKKMIHLVESIPKGVENHDYWIALCALSSKKGKIIYIPEETMIHRMHQNNVTGTQDSQSIKKRLLSVKRMFVGNGASQRFFTLQRCYEELNKKYGSKNPKVIELKSILGNKKFHNIYQAVRLGFRGMNWHATLYFYIALLRGGK